MEKIVASVEGIIFRNEDNGYTVAEIALGDELETCVGMLPGLREGERVELSGGLWRPLDSRRWILSITTLNGSRRFPASETPRPKRLPRPSASIWSCRR